MSKFQNKIIKKLTNEGFNVLKIIRLNKNGYPDLLAIKKGETDLWIEVKEKNDTLKPLQMQRIDDLNNLGKIALAVQKSKGIIYPYEYFGSSEVIKWLRNL